MKVCLLLISASMCFANVQTLQVPHARDMSVVVPVSQKGLSVSLPILNDYPHGYAIEKNLRVKLGCYGNNLICEYEIPYRRGYQFRPTKKHDGALWHEDSVEIFIKQAKASKTYCQYIINPIGTVFDKNTLRGSKWNSNNLEVESRLANNVWLLKVSIPLSDIGMNHITQNTEIGFNTAVRSVDSRNKYILGLFPFFPNRFAQPGNFARVRLKVNGGLFVSKFQRKNELKNGITYVVPYIGLGNSSNKAERIALSDKQYSIAPFSTVHVNLAPQKITGLRGIVKVYNLAGMAYALNMSNPFAPQITFIRSGKDKILIECSNVRQLACVYDKVKIKFGNLKPVEFKPEILNGAMFSCKGLKPGNRLVTIESIKDGRVINKVATTVLVIDETPIDFDLSKLDVSKYYPPMQVNLPVIKAARSRIKLAPKSTFPKSIKVDGAEILNGPAFFTINKRSKQNDKKITLTSQNKNRISFTGSFRIAQNNIAQKAFLDYDGLVWLDNKIKLKTKNKAQIITATIPVKLKGDIFLNYGRLIRNWQLTPERFKTEGTFNKNYLAWSKKLKDGKTVVLPLTSMISVVNNFRGLVIYPPVNPAGLNIKNYDKYIEITRNGENVDVTITLSDGKAAFASRNLDFTLGLQPIPIHQYNNRANFDFRVYKGSRSGHDLIHAQGKIDATINTGKTWIIPFQCWTEYQNYYTTYRYADVMHKLISMLHNRHKRVMPYFGFEISDVCPEAELYLKTVSTGQAGGYIRENYAQQCWSVCYASQWGDYWLRGIKKFLPEYDIDGMYMDGTLGVPSCVNELHGHGMRDSRGRCVPYFPLLEIRRFSQILYQLTHRYKSDFLLYLHNSHPFVPATMGFVDVILNGEQTKPILGTWKIPLDVYRAEFNGRQIGVPQQILSYSARTTYRREYAGSLLFGQTITPWTVSRMPEVKFTEAVWKIFDKYKLYGKYFVPFYSPDAKIKDAGGKALVSYYDTPQYLAIIISNYSGRDKTEASISLNHFTGRIKTTAFEALDKKEIPIANNSINVTVGKENFKFIIIDKI